jgi:hypothetical protein
VLTDKEYWAATGLNGDNTQACIVTFTAFGGIGVDLKGANFTFGVCAAAKVWICSDQAVEQLSDPRRFQ